MVYDTLSMLSHTLTYALWSLETVSIGGVVSAEMLYSVGRNPAGLRTKWIDADLVRGLILSKGSKIQRLSAATPGFVPYAPQSSRVLASIK